VYWASKFTERVKSVTGKDKYDIGDLFKWLDEKCREKEGAFACQEQV
jgi:hypothetical protein